MSIATVSWTPPIGGFYESYDIFAREEGAAEWEFRDSTRANRIDLAFPDYGTWEIGIAPVVNGVVAAPDDWTIVPWTPQDVVDQATLATPTNFRAAQEGNAVVAMWDRSTDKHIDHYEIRGGANWESGQIMARAAGNAGEARFNPWTTGQQSFFIKSRTKDGRESTSTSYILTVYGDEYGPVKATVDEHGGGYTGTKTTVEVSGGNLIQSPRPVAGTDLAGIAGSTLTYPFFGPNRNGGTYVTTTSSAGFVVDERIEVGVTLAMTKTMPTGKKLHRPVRRRADTAGGVLSPGERSKFSQVAGDGTIKDGIVLRVEIDTSQDAVPTWDGWRDWVPGATYRFYQVRLRFTLTSPWPFCRLSTTAMTWKRRRQNRKTEGSQAITGTGGTDITFPSGMFTEAPYITGNTIHASNAYYVTFSNVSTTGAKVRFWDAAGAEQSSGTIHWHAMGT